MSEPVASVTAGQLRARLDEVSLRDRRRFESALRRARKVRNAEKRRARLDRIASQIDVAVDAFTRRGGTIPTVTVPSELPIAAYADQIINTIESNQVVVVAGETGSGKSTQLPKLALAAGRGRKGLIGHTQPRRLAARAVASRLAEELGSNIGELVGFTVRFTDTVKPTTLVKVMTDGILLSEMQRDPQLLAYDTLIIDEAHERALNIDFLLGYLAQLLPQRPDLTVIVTSATIDTARFADHFASDNGPAPIFEVSGRTYPVELRYRPLDGTPGVNDAADNDTASTATPVIEQDIPTAIADAVIELCAEGPGDVLVFASGERDIRDAADAIADAARTAAGRAVNLASAEVLPLYARLSPSEQERVFATHTKRRIVIATNIAETSLTVPGIRYVVDPGLARVSRFGRRSKVQRLPIEPVSQASATQRSGRCGRTGPGIAVRLYSEADFDARPAFTDPEILRTNLASVVLQMASLGLGDIASFPFLEPPDTRQVSDAVTTLKELGALTERDVSEPSSQDRDAADVVTTGRRKRGGELTTIGRQMARLPLDPRLARAVLAAVEERCVHEVLVIVAFLSIPDPRLRPLDNAHSAARYHDRFTVPGSDFLTVLALWNHLSTLRKRTSRSGFAKACRTEFLHHLRVREWQDVYRQLQRVTGDLKIPETRQDNPGDDVHRALLTGLLSNVGVRADDARSYRGTRGGTFVIDRHSAAVESPPPWVVAAELVETTRTFAGTVAAVQPRWIEDAAGDLVTVSHDDPRWDGEQGRAVVTKRVSFRGLPLVQGRTVALGSVDRAHAQELFFDNVLLADSENRPTGATWAFLVHNDDVVAEVKRVQRRVDGPVGSPYAVLNDRYRTVLPAEVASVQALTRWVARNDHGEALQITVDDVLNDDVAWDPSSFPDVQHVDGVSTDVTYRSDDGGVHFAVPVAALGDADPGRFEWLVPGLRHELVVALIRRLPKTVRRHFVPAPEVATQVLKLAGPDDGPLLTVIASALTRIGGVTVSPKMWAGVAIPEHLRPSYTVVDGDTELASGPSLRTLRSGVINAVGKRLEVDTEITTHTGLSTWPPEAVLPPTVETVTSGLRVTGYPSLFDEGTTVGVTVMPTKEQQSDSMWEGTRRLLRLRLSNPLRAVDRGLKKADKLALTLAPHASIGDVVEDCVTCVLDAMILEHGVPFSRTRFDELAKTADDDAVRLTVVVARIVADVVRATEDVKTALRESTTVDQAVKLDVARHLGRLVHPRFISATGSAHIVHLERYVRVLQHRLVFAAKNPIQDAENQIIISAFESQLNLIVTQRTIPQSKVNEVRWMIEELRASYFSTLRTPNKISSKQVARRIAELNY